MRIIGNPFNDQRTGGQPTSPRRSAPNKTGIRQIKLPDARFVWSADMKTAIGKVCLRMVADLPIIGINSPC